MTGRRTDAPPLSEPWICVKCTAVRGAHYLTCPVLRLPPDRARAEKRTRPVNTGQQPCRAHPDDCPNGPGPHAYHPPELEGLPCCRQPGEEVPS